MRKALSILLVPVLVCALVGNGLAEDGRFMAANRWYGWQILAADTASLLTFTVGGTQDNWPAFYLGAASYLITPAAIHVVHGNYGRAGLGTLLRTVLPVGGALLTYTLLSRGSDRPDSEYNRLGWGMMSLFVFFVGLGVASGVDITYASKPRVSPTWLPPPTASTLGTLTMAGIVPTTSGAQLMVGGRF